MSLCVRITGANTNTNTGNFIFIKNSAFIYVILWKNNYIPFLKNTGDNEIKK